MTGPTEQIIAAPPSPPAAKGAGEVPAWVFTMLGLGAEAVALAEWHGEAHGQQQRRLEGANKTLWSLRVPQALSLDADEFEQACAAAYRTLGSQVSASEHPFAVRWWNFIPGILEPLGALEHRYMVFNAGRFQALAAAGSTAFGRLATASAVGYDGEHFYLHCLSAKVAGLQIENPRQIPAWRYSLRYGPKPPCFARATRIERSVEKDPWLLVGGTASVCGEDSCHRDDLQAQLEETLRNLAALVWAAEGHEAGEAGLTVPAAEIDGLLGRYRELRVYHPHPHQGPELEKELRRRLGPEVRLEMVPAVLCRQELLVEIEGLARLEV